MIRHVAVIDLGKTNSKVALVDTVNANEVQVIKQQASVRTDSLYPSLDHQAIEAFIVDALHALSTLHSIDAITVTSHGATAALIDKSGELVLPVVDYEFTDIDELRAEYENVRPAFAESGSPSLPGGLNIGAQLYWQQRNYASLFKQVDSILTWPQFWVHTLTGERHNDVTSLGAHTDLYEPRKQQYSSLVVKQQWINKMPPSTLPGVISGTLTPKASKRLGMPSKIPVYTGIHDSNASLVPHLISQSAPFSVVSTGTWFISMAIGGTKTILDETRDTLINVDANGNSVPSARFMGGRERDLLKVTEPVSEEAMNSLLNSDAIPPMLMPSTVSGTGPFPSTKNQWLGSNIENDTTIKDCAVTLYLALMTRECLLLIGAKGPTFIEGPLAHDKQFSQMLAAATDRPVLTSNTLTGTSVGATMLLSAPKKQLEYKTVVLEDSKKAKLQQYATQWQGHLEKHIKQHTL